MKWPHEHFSDMVVWIVEQIGKKMNKSKVVRRAANTVLIEKMSHNHKLMNAFMSYAMGIEFWAFVSGWLLTIVGYGVFAAVVFRIVHGVELAVGGIILALIGSAFAGFVHIVRFTVKGMKWHIFLLAIASTILFSCLSYLNLWGYIQLNQVQMGVIFLDYLLVALMVRFLWALLMTP